MDFLKDLFSEEGLKFDDFVSKVNEKGYKLADLSKGSYVDKKKYDDDITSHNTKYSELEKKYNELTESIKSADGGVQKKYDDLLANYNTLKTEKEAVDKKVTGLERKEIARGAGINNERLLNLALFELQDSQNFENDIKDWAKNNKNVLGGTGRPIPPLGGNPDDDGSDDKFLTSFYKSAGVDAKDLK